MYREWAFRFYLRPTACLLFSIHLFLFGPEKAYSNELTMPHSMLVCSVPCRCQYLALFCPCSWTRAPFLLAFQMFLAIMKKYINSETINYVPFWTTEKKNHTHKYTYAHWNRHYPIPPPIFLSYSQHLWPHKGQTSQLQPQMSDTGFYVPGSSPKWEVVSLTDLWNGLLSVSLSGLGHN